MVINNKETPSRTETSFRKLVVWDDIFPGIEGDVKIEALERCQSHLIDAGLEYPRHFMVCRRERMYIFPAEDALRFGPRKSRIVRDLEHLQATVYSMSDPSWVKIIAFCIDRVALGFFSSMDAAVGYYMSRIEVGEYKALHRV